MHPPPVAVKRNEPDAIPWLCRASLTPRTTGSGMELTVAAVRNSGCPSHLQRLSGEERDCKSDCRMRSGRDPGYTFHQEYSLRLRRPEEGSCYPHENGIQPWRRAMYKDRQMPSWRHSAECGRYTCS